MTRRGAFAATRAIWSDLPAVLGEVVTGAANAMVRGVEQMLNAVLGRVNRFIAGINTVLGALPAWAVGEDGIRIGALDAVSIGGFEARFAGAARDAGGRAAEAFPQALEREYQIPDLGLGAYAADARKYERLGEWAERIGWERFFEKCQLDFTHHLIDDFRDPAYYTWRQTTNFKF